MRECYFALLILSKWEFSEEYVQTYKVSATGCTASEVCAKA